MTARFVFENKAIEENNSSSAISLRNKVSEKSCTQAMRINLSLSHICKSMINDDKRNLLNNFKKIKKIVRIKNSLGVEPKNYQRKKGKLIKFYFCHRSIVETMKFVCEILVSF